MKKYNYNMNLLRGIAMILVLIGHAIFADFIMMKNIPNTSMYINIYSFIYQFHMPLFFFISGFFAKKCFEVKTKKDYFELLKNKTLKLFIPYLTFSVIALIIKVLLESYTYRGIDLNNAFYNIFLNPWKNPLKLLWFIYTLYIIFLIMPFFNKVNNKIKILMLSIIWILPYGFGSIFNITGVIRYSLFFCLGYEFYKYYNKYLEKKKTIIRPIVLISVLIFINMVDIVPTANIHTYMCSVLAIIALVDIVHIVNLNNSIIKLIGYVGTYSMDIYLLHWFFQMPVRILYERFNFSYNLLFIFSFLLSFLSIPISKYMIRKVKIFSFLCFGIVDKKIKKNIFV